jgi:hypothetical protein
MLAIKHQINSQNNLKCIKEETIQTELNADIVAENLQTIEFKNMRDHVSQVKSKDLFLVLPKKEEGKQLRKENNNLIIKNLKRMSQNGKKTMKHLSKQLESQSKCSRLKLKVETLQSLKR